MKLTALFFVFGLMGISNATDKRIHVLFVGNSLTYVNNLPLLVEQAAHVQGNTIETEMLAYPNYALEDHWNDGTLQERIASGKFQYVVVQQGPSSQADGRTMLLEYGKRIKSLCDQHDTQLVFFMVWPARANLSTFDGVIRNYTEAANTTGAILCPVGKIWKEHFERTNDYSYYGPDDFHPSLAGSNVAAASILHAVQEKQ